MQFRILLAAAWLVAMPAIAIAQNADTTGDDSGSDALMQANDDMMDAMMGVQPTGDTDHDFVTMMIAHHQGAVAMAKVELDHGQDAEIRTLAQSIVAAQEKEIEQMKAWLAAHPQ